MAAPKSFRFPACNFIIKETTAKCFFVNFAKFLRTSFFWQSASGWLLVVFICEFRVFQNTSFIEDLWKTAISCTIWGISTTRYSKKLFHRSFQAFNTRTRSSDSKAFIYLKSLKTVCEEVSVIKLRDANFQVNEKNSFSYLHSCILPSFSQNTHDYFSRRGFESEPAQFRSESVSGK